MKENIMSDYGNLVEEKRLLDENRAALKKRLYTPGMPRVPGRTFAVCQLTFMDGYAEVLEERIRETKRFDEQQRECCACRQ